MYGSLVITVFLPVLKQGLRSRLKFRPLIGSFNVPGLSFGIPFTVSLSVSNQLSQLQRFERLLFDMGKTKFNRYRGIRKRRKITSNPVLIAARDLLSSARARPTKEKNEDETLSTSAKKLE